MKRTTLMGFLRPTLVALVVALWTSAAGLAAPPASVIRAQMRNSAGVAGTSAAPSSISVVDSTYLALEKLAQALHAVVVPGASGGMPRLRGYADAARLADEVLGAASTLRDQANLAAAIQAQPTGPADGRRDALVDLASH